MNVAVNLHILLVQVPREHFLNQAHIDRDGEGRVGHTVQWEEWVETTVLAVRMFRSQRVAFYLIGHFWLRMSLIFLVK